MACCKRFEFSLSDPTFCLLRETVVRLNSHKFITFLMKRDYPFLFPKGKKPIFFGDYVANPSKFQSDYSEELTEILCGTDELVEDTYLGRTGSFTDMARVCAGLTPRYINDVYCNNEKAHCMTPEQRVEEFDDEPILPKIKGPQMVLFNALKSPFQARPGSPFQPYMKPWQFQSSCSTIKTPAMTQVQPPPIPKRTRICNASNSVATVEQLAIPPWKKVHKADMDELLLELAETVTIIQPLPMNNYTLLKPEKSVAEVSEMYLKEEVIEESIPFVESFKLLPPVEVVHPFKEISDLKTELPVIRNDAVRVQAEKSASSGVKSDCKIIETCKKYSYIPSLVELSSKCLDEVNNNKKIVTINSSLKLKLDANKRAYKIGTTFQVPNLTILAKAKLSIFPVPSLANLAQKCVMCNPRKYPEMPGIKLALEVPKLATLAKAKLLSRRIPRLSELAQKCLDESHHVGYKDETSYELFSIKEREIVENNVTKRPSKFKRFRRGCARFFRRLFCKSRRRDSNECVGCAIEYNDTNLASVENTKS